MKIRRATPDDVPAVARVVLSALTDEAPWRAFFPRKAHTDPTYIEYCEAILRSYLEPGTKADRLFLVVEVSAAETKTKSGPVIVAAAVWDTSTSLGQRQGNSQRQASVGEGLHSNAVAAIDSHSDGKHGFSLNNVPGKLAALSQATAAGRREHFSGHVPYVFLHLLATRPDYQRKGYGRALCASGINVARQQNASICLQTGSRGYILFSGLGFVDKGLVTLPMEPGTDDVHVKAMILDYGLIRRRGSIFDSIIRYISD